MKMQILLAVVVGVVMQGVPGSDGFARGEGNDSWLGGVMKSMGNSRNDTSSRDSNQYDDNRRGDDDRRGDDHRRYSEHQSSDPDQIVRRAYQDVLNREPDQQGLRVFRSRIIDDKWSEQDVRNALRKSDEYARQGSASVDNIIRRAYQDVLGREADQQGLATYRAKMENQGWSERDVRADLKKSSERREKGDVSQEQAQQIVRQAYRDTLNRDPDASSSLYVERVMRNHWTVDTVSRELRNSPEYKKKHGK